MVAQRRHSATPPRGMRWKQPELLLFMTLQCWCRVSGEALHLDAFVAKLQHQQQCFDGKRFTCESSCESTVSVSIDSNGNDPIRTAHRTLLRHKASTSRTCSLSFVPPEKRKRSAYKFPPTIPCNDAIQLVGNFKKISASGFGLLRASFRHRWNNVILWKFDKKRKTDELLVVGCGRCDGLPARVTEWPPLEAEVRSRWWLQKKNWRKPSERCKSDENLNMAMQLT